MSNKMNKVLSKLFGIFDILRGDKVYIKTKTVQDDYSRLRFVMAMGYELKILVKRSTIVVRYQNRIFGQKRFHLYEVNATVPENAPEWLSLHMAKPLTFPNLLLTLSSREAQVEAAMMAFLDIKLAEI